MKMKQGRAIEGLRYHAADVANIINANDDVVNSRVVMERPVQARWMMPAKNQKVCKTVITLCRIISVQLASGYGEVVTYRDRESTEFLSDIFMLSKSGGKTKSCSIR